MPMFMVERTFAEQLELTAESEARNLALLESHDITWLTSFLSADKRKTYCLYEADDIELLRMYAADLGIPPGVIVEVSEMAP